MIRSSLQTQGKATLIAISYGNASYNVSDPIIKQNTNILDVVNGLEQLTLNEWPSGITEIDSAIQYLNYGQVQSSCEESVNQVIYVGYRYHYKTTPAYISDFANAGYTLEEYEYDANQQVQRI